MLELDAALSKSTLEAGERTTLRIQIQNPDDDCTSDANVVVRAPASIALISTGPYVRSNITRNEVELALPAPLRGQRYDVAVDAYALAPGDAEIAVWIECDDV